MAERMSRKAPPQASPYRIHSLGHPITLCIEPSSTRQTDAVAHQSLLKMFNIIKELIPPALLQLRKGTSSTPVLFLHDGRPSTGVVDVCLIPEVAFKMEGDSGLVKYVDKVLSERGHCVLCLAEGAGQVPLRALTHTQYPHSHRLNSISGTTWYAWWNSAAMSALLWRKVGGGESSETCIDIQSCVSVNSWAEAVGLSIRSYWCWVFSLQAYILPLEYLCTMSAKMCHPSMH